MPPMPWPRSARSRNRRPARSGRAARRPQFDVARIDEIEREVKHDVIAFLTHLAEHVGPDARFVHAGHDLLGRARHLLQRAARARRRLLIADVDQLLAALKRRAHRAQDHARPSAARTASMPSRPPSGSSWRRPMPSSRAPASGSLAARKEVATGAISGAVGTFAQIDPRVEVHVARAMKLVPEPVSTQVIPRDRHAMYFATLGVVASSVERLATEIRHLQRTEVLEAEEFFSQGQKGSSAMPHKRNPGADREPDGPCPRRARLCDAGAGERGALARARHLAFVGRAHDRPRCDGDARLRAQPARGRDRQARGLSREHADAISTGWAA